MFYKSTLIKVNILKYNDVNVQQFIESILNILFGLKFVVLYLGARVSAIVREDNLITKVAGR